MSYSIHYTVYCTSYAVNYWLTLPSNINIVYLYHAAHAVQCTVYNEQCTQCAVYSVHGTWYIEIHHDSVFKYTSVNVTSCYSDALWEY